MQDFFRYVMSAVLAVVTAMAPPSLPFHVQAVPPVLSAADASPSDTLAREQCLAISLGMRAASECGDLRLAHALPSVRTYEKDRAPVLIYNSDQASPHPVVAANVTLSAVNLNRVTAVLRVNGRQRALGQWMGATWPTTGAARIAVAYDATEDSTNVYRYTLDVTAFYGADSATSRMSGRIAVVNRVASVFGAGWWIDGLEQLFVDPFGNPGLWIGGDGSVRRYVAVRGDSTAWTAASIDRPDTLRRVDSTGFVRILAGGVRVRFDAQGRHVATVNRLGHTTTFGYDGQNRLQSIVVPPTAAAASYAFSYSGVNRLQRVTLSAGSGGGFLTRVTTIANGTARLDAITDPDGIATGFGYDGPVGGRVTSRTDKRGTVTHFRYVAGIKVAGAMTRLTDVVTGALTDSIVTTIAPAEVSGLVDPVPTASVATLLDGPRRDVADTTHFYLNRFGAPRAIHDALGRVTTLLRENATYPALVTGLVAPSGFTTVAHYDARGNPDVVTAVNPYGDGRDATTTYAWDPRWDAVIRTTLPDSTTASSDYDPGTGDLRSAQAHGDTTRFFYTTPGVLDSVLTSDGAVDRYRHDDAAHNLTGHTGPRGQVTSVVHDGLGRDTVVSLTAGPVLRVQTTRYDVMGRPVVTIDSAGTDALEVHTAYDRGGLIDSVTQWARPAPLQAGRMLPILAYYRYDAVGRTLSESGNNWLVRLTTYDLAGNVTSSTHAPGDTLAYDALNRLRARVGGPDSATYTYDGPTGQLRAADNAFAQVRRTYYPNGALRGDTLAIANESLTGFDPPDGLAMAYDLTGRRTQLQYPADLARTVTSRYDTGPLGTGQLARIEDSGSGSVHTFRYDLRGRLATLVRRATAPDSIVETRGYDLESNRTAHTIVGQDGTVYVSNPLVYDGLNRVWNSASGDSLVRYDGLGHVTYAHGLATVPVERSTYDAFGNRLTNTQCCGRPGGTTTFRIDPQANRVASFSAVSAADSPALLFPDTTTNGYTSQGTLETSETRHPFGYRTDGLPQSQYGASDTGYVRTRRTNRYRATTLVRSDLLRDTVWIASTQSLHGTPYQSAETYRYDALGRRVWRATTYPDYRCEDYESVDWCVSTAIASVWDGAELLHERRTLITGYQTANAALTPQTGVVGYVHALGLDHPLVILKAGGHDVLPFANWTGKLVTGACPAAQCAASDVSFPQNRSSLLGARRGVARQGQWYGSLLEGMRDGSGYIYQRNRYLDPETGHFTQPDPIGLAGGLNVYGFAGGDPVNFSDPFGLCPVPAYTCPGYWTALGTAAGAIIGGTGGGAGGFLAGFGIGAIPGGLAGAGQGAALGGAAGALVDGLVHSTRQGRSVQLASSLEENISGHLGTVGKDPNAEDSNHHRGEIRGWIDRVEKYAQGMKGKTQEAWMKKVAEWSKALDDLTPK